jgi:putative peptide zinc metalloprotease protein
MAVVESRISLWEALAGRAPGQPVGPADPGLWSAVAERINPAKARPRLRAGVEEANLVSVRGVPYTMLRSPDDRKACYLRLAPEEVELAHLMDGTRTLARLVGDFARTTGRLAPDQVRRVAADLAGNRMLDELPVDAFRPLERVHRKPWPVRLGRGVLAILQGRRVALANIDPLITLLYRAGGRLFFTRAVAALMFTLGFLGLFAFGYQWWSGEQSVFLTRDSYFVGAAVLLGLNVVALVCHELGHALATKHAGRRVPTAGLLVYFGIPSVFVDTTDVWMAGRRGRILTTLAGPATGLVLAGTSALVGFAVPEAAPWCFKLSFAWYVNALFNLNPFLALDGYYLLMDWLEVSNLRAKGLAWVVARLRRRPPRWRDLDREGRFAALYGVMAIGWLAIALNVGYRVYVDRVAGLGIGLWRSGWVAQLLLVAVVAALAAPAIYFAFGWLARRWRRLRRRIADARAERDAPRRLDALRATTLRDLPPHALAQLARSARWVYPRSGSQVVFAGAAQPTVYAVVEGALEARAPGDPVGTVRERVGPGGLVGVAAAVAGTPAPWAWHTAGTTLLAIPSSAVAQAIADSGITPGGSFGTGAEAEVLLNEAPATAHLSTEDTMGLATVATPISLAPDATVDLRGPADALLIASGVVVLPTGQTLGRGTLMGPSGEDAPTTIGTARTAVRLFSFPADSGRRLLVRGTNPPGSTTDSDGPTGANTAPGTGVHPPAGYPPLAVPPGPPTRTRRDHVDGRFERRLRWALVLVLLLALFLTGGNVLWPPLTWAEMPHDKALLTVERGRAVAVVDGVSTPMSAGESVYIGASDVVTVADRSRARVTYRGGAASLLCAGSEVGVDQLQTTGRPEQPSASMVLRRGTALTDTATASPTFTDLAATWRSNAGVAVSTGSAWFVVTGVGVTVSEGTVALGGFYLPAMHEPLGCPGEPASRRPSGEHRGPLDLLLPPPDVTTSAAGTTPPPDTTSTDVTPTTAAPTESPTESPTGAPTSSATTAPPPTDPGGPSISWVTSPTGQTVAQALPSGAPCTSNPLHANLAVRDDTAGVNNRAATHVVFRWLETAPAYNQDQHVGGPNWTSSTPTVAFPSAGGTFTVRVTAYDAQGQASNTLQAKLNVAPCIYIASVTDSPNPLNQTPPSPDYCFENPNQVYERLSVQAEVLSNTWGAGLNVWMTWSVSVDGAGGKQNMLLRTGTTYVIANTLPVFWKDAYSKGGTLHVTVNATDTAGNQATSRLADITLAPCTLIVIPR